MSTKSQYQVIKDVPIGNTVAAMRSRQIATTVGDQRQWTIMTFDLSQPPMFYHLIGFIEKISGLHHPHICEIRELDVEGNQLRVVLPASQDTLAERIAKNHRSSEETVLKWIFQIASAFQTVLQEARLVFENLGPLDAACCTICDQNNVCVDILELWLRSGIDPTQTVDLTMAVSWAPEYLRWEQEGDAGVSTGSVDEKGQIWALGIVAYNAAMLTSPFFSDAPLILMDKIMREVPTVSAEFSESFRDLISKKLLAKQPHDRISIQDLLHDPLISNMSNGFDDTLSDLLPISLNSITTTTRVMVAEQKEVSQPECGEEIEVFEPPQVMTSTLSSNDKTANGCRLF